MQQALQESIGSASQTQGLLPLPKATDVCCRVASGNELSPNHVAQLFAANTAQTSEPSELFHAEEDMEAEYAPKQPKASKVIRAISVFPVHHKR